MAALLDAVFNLIKQEYAKKEPRWKRITLPQTDLAFLQKECATPSDFDPHNVRNGLVQKMLQGKSTEVTMSCEYGQVCAVFDYPQQQLDLPWRLWGRILRLYTERKQNAKHTSLKPFKIFFLANTHLRQFPKQHEAIEPIHINGGYTYPCNHETIIIYRAEDATRVLLHELQHSCCLDHQRDGVDRVEAETEAWAELLYIGLLSKGNPRQFQTFLQTQSDWIRCQNENVRKHIRDTMQFPWRYTVGKEAVWQRWNILQPLAARNPCTSLRLTFPPGPMLKKQFGVFAYSTML